MKIARIAGRRFLGLIVVVWGVSTLLFFLIRVSGDPALVVAGPNATQSQLEIIRQQMGLNHPEYIQYWQFIRHAFIFNFGDSFQYHTAAMVVVLERFPASALLATTAVILAVVVGVPAGAFAAVHHNKLGDAIIGVIAFIAQSIPDFVVGVILILLFSQYMHLLPSIGLAGPQSLIMPAVALSLFIMARQARLVRSLMLVELPRDYVRASVAGGVSWRKTQYWLVAKNVLSPVLGLSSVDLGALLGGAVVIETVFGWPGVGSLLLDSVETRDYPTVQAAIFIIAIAVVVVNLIIEQANRMLSTSLRVANA